MLAACFGPGSVDPNADYKNFLAAATQAPAEGYTMYWLGRSFTAGGLTFEGPGVPDFGGEQEGGGVAMSYSARLPGGPVVLNIGLLSDAAWAPSSQRLETPTIGGVKMKTVMIAGRSAELQTASGGTRPVNVLTLFLTLGNTHVIASAHAEGTATPGGPDVNPLIDEQTFLSVMQQLRPYPQ